MKSEKVFIGLGIFIFLILAIAGFGSLSSTSNTNNTSGDAAQASSTTDEKGDAKAELIKTNWNAYTSYGTNWAIITGIIKNTGNTNVRVGNASGTVYGLDGKVAGNSTDSIYPTVLAPGEEGYVSVKIMDTVKKSEIKDAKIQFTFDETDEDPIKLDVINDSGKEEQYGGYEVTGELKNTSNKEITEARALVLLFDSEDNLITAEIAFPTPDTIPSQGTVAFRASTTHLDDMIATYKVIGFSTEWKF